MAEIYLHNKQIESVFELLGDRENSITYSIGWALANCKVFLDEFVKTTLRRPIQNDETIIQLQEHKKDSGITDIEIRGTDFHIIIEAKKGWVLPDDDQLALYAKRFITNNNHHNIIISMSECSKEYASIHLPRTINGIPVRHFSWKDVTIISEKVTNATHAEKRQLNQLRSYLKRIVNMQNQSSNMVYVVSLASGIPEGCSISWIDIIEKKKHYFHPVDKGWPSNPPNYLGFRYGGKLQSVHHVESWKITKDLHSEIKEIGPNNWNYKHYLYSLGPAIIPNKDVKNGKIYPSGRYNIMLDLLLTCDTVYEARNKTNERLEEDS